MNTTQNNSIRERAQKLLALSRPRADWVNPRVLDYLDHGAGYRERGIRPYSVGTWVTAHLRAHAQKLSPRYFSSFWKSLEILELAGLVEPVRSRTGSPAYWWKGE